jgi:hypothetical protein
MCSMLLGVLLTTELRFPVYEPIHPLAKVMMQAAEELAGAAMKQPGHWRFMESWPLKPLILVGVRRHIFGAKYVVPAPY